MEGSSGNRELYNPHFRDMIANESKWVVRRDEVRFGASEDKKLELRLGPPGEDWFEKGNIKKDTRDRDESLLSLGHFSSMAYKTTNNHSVSAGAKRGFLDTIEAKAEEKTWMMNLNTNQNQKLSSSEKPGGVSFSTPSPWSSTPTSPSASQVKTQQQQQQQKPQFLQFPSVPQRLPVMSKEPSQTCSTKVTDLQNPEKKACSPASASVPANTAVLNSSQKRTSPAPVVGWPPIRSFRKNLASSSNSKPASEIRDTPSADVNGEKTEASRKTLFVKINMDGVPIGRKVDLKAYDSYEKLSSAVDELFRDLLAAQGDSSAAGDQKKAEPKAITGLLDGKGEYTLVYEDNEGDRMLVGDVPWQMFVSTVKRLRVLKSSELPKLQIGNISKPERTRVDCGVK
ncbi:auxin-responsive protein IAA26-like [Macadamia integrifolia]|uniref:auxin-responsive protein IAA26-like n=1 Tax=Macadamia integrifolia TaxID=60698 RepID=UPI001C4F30D7|nr:auxin-responsive protein IAA26-like [Macadamia integrifolia]XP_042492358.1 auxin-responsive protein IAA26-like [Macadamia integrifolia]